MGNGKFAWQRVAEKRATQKHLKPKLRRLPIPKLAVSLASPYSHEQFTADMAEAKATLTGRALGERLGELRRKRSANK